VNWLEVANNQYAVVDPNDPTSILYLSKREYLKLEGIALSNDQRVTILAHPNETRPSDKDIKADRPQNSPPPLLLSGAKLWQGMRSRLIRSYRAMLSPDRDYFSAVKVACYLNGLVIRWSLALGHWAGLTQSVQGWLSDIRHILPHLQQVLKEQGTHGLVLRLKHSYQLISQFLADTPKLSNAYGHPVRVAHGLPKWIPVNARSAIRQRSTRVIRFWLSLLYIYKVIEMPYNIKKAFPSITEPVSSFIDWKNDAVVQLLLSYRYFLDTHFIPSLGGPFDLPKDEPGTIFAPVTSGPNGSPAVNKVGEDAAALYRDRLDGGGIIDNILEVADFHRVEGERPLEVYDITDAGKQTELEPENAKKSFLHSKVHVLAEPAGKLRPVAIVDIFTQRVMKPLHTHLFGIVKGIKQDGTHNQTELLGWLKDQMSGAWKGFWWSSIDISSATDNISCRLLKILLVSLYGKSSKAQEYADSVIRLITDRDFSPAWDIKLKKAIPPVILAVNTPKSVRYAEGQPMGILGSFGLLALWNHSWVQFAGYSVTGQLINSYGVTGDDVVIAEASSDTPVGRKYIENSNICGIPISLSKSFTSCRLFNFLSRTVLAEGEVSPISIREDFQIRDSSGRVNRAINTNNRGWWESTSNGWLSKAVKQFLYPSEYLVYSASARRGTLNGIGLRAVLSFLSPSVSRLAHLGVSRVPVLSWLSAFAGSTILLRHGELARNDSLLCSPDIPVLQYKQSILDLVINEVFDVLQWNDLAAGEYETWRLQQCKWLQEPGLGSLFLPTGWDFSVYHLDDNRFMYPEINSGLTTEELSNKLGEAYWTDENVDSAILRALSWLASIPKSRDYSQAKLFEHQAQLARRNKSFGEDLFNQNERRMLSLLYRVSVLYPGAIDIGINDRLIAHLERKYINMFAG